jgi:hypothetical protein
MFSVPLCFGRYLRASSRYLIFSEVVHRLAFRKFPKKYPLIAWLPIFGVLSYNPYLIIALIEPTVRLVENLREENYVAKIEDIKRLGWSVFRSVMLLYILTLAVLYFT